MHIIKQLTGKAVEYTKAAELDDKVKVFIVRFQT